MSGNNVFDGLFASPERDIAASHGNTVFIYHVDDDKIAKSSDLDARFQEVYAFLHNELDTADVEEIADRVMWDNNSDIEDFADILSPRLGSDINGAYSWELQRLRGRVIRQSSPQPFRKVPMPLRFDTGWRISPTEPAGG
ncbi:hypothetical protein [Escherichia coli]|uniref:hypothetical protein n=1 Tax=Escherichia coli TaxID=562 RepID=UPI0015D34CF1|nr:hypothetical protein [Escherichia coli]EIM4338217.1 hypothetical protein [Escherichia coli]EIM7772280.1 hypothetical protein [Escherichia coli]